MNWLAAGRAVFGIAALAAADRFGADVADAPLAAQSRWAIRILGARQLLQAVICAPSPTRCVRELEAVVDGVHAATMTAVAAAAHRRSTRRIAAINVVSAVAFLLADVVTAGASGVNDGVEQRNRVLAVRDGMAQIMCRLLRLPNVAKVE